MSKIRFGKPHTHRDIKGALVTCYHSCKIVFTWQFWVFNFWSFPIEHFIWEKLWPFKLLTHWLGL